MTTPAAEAAYALADAAYNAAYDAYASASPSDDAAAREAFYAAAGNLEDARDACETA